MESKTYNGWTNYETWRINLEVFSESDYEGVYADEIGEFTTEGDIGGLASTLENYVEEFVLGDAEGLAAGYARSFVSDASFWEMAEHMIEDWKSNNKAKTA